MNGTVGKGIGSAALAALTSLGIMGLGIIGTMGPAFAGANCDSYAKLTLQQAKQNRDRRCNFTGPAWSLDARKHRAWCRDVGPAVWRAELSKRRRMLDGCKR